MEKYNLEKKDIFLTSAQAAEFLNISLGTLKKLIQQGRVKSFKTPGGHHRINKRDLLEKLYDD
ncbi:MAG TPA: helix-turn-helix domain-containing protein [Candidatus Omnitrophota bacterium]|jgi:excisionase family DNA binding protein|nr:helix-turn-helix domain-containing protein [Candidatus Omnitrophota bacterium]HPN56314.1 helix-turn-helix domain-containing protein [Candidatus Omnitrophota bacterium]